MRAIISVLGQDKPGIIAHVSAVLYECNVNILDMDQTVMRDEIFVMTMLVDLDGMTKAFSELQEKLDSVSAQIGMQVKLQREELFNSMHKV
ncbi:ACT domain-containing protein [Christensenellaceae bacterium OttesenSCG-928-K19]|nr:ACT domain-containing protein [Christensenellaceae bacterium OttesenSCG-928-K19]